MASGETKKCNELTGKEWLQNSFSIWRDLKKTAEERAYKHPASFPVSLCEKLIRTFAPANCNVLDPFNGIGSTTAAAAELGCSAVGIDLSKAFCKIASKRVCDHDRIRVICGDSFSEISQLPKASFDICVTSPPYWDILNMKHSADKKDSVNYSDKSEDLGNIADYSEFVRRLTSLFAEVKNVLKPNAYCIINVMDIRKKSVFYPLHSDLATALQGIGYVYDDLIIWDRQSDYNNMRPLGYPTKFRIYKVHEYLLIFINKYMTIK